VDDHVKSEQERRKHTSTYNLPISNTTEFKKNQWQNGILAEVYEFTRLHDLDILALRRQESLTHSKSRHLLPLITKRIL
jgi:hypothetical protein